MNNKQDNVDVFEIYVDGSCKQNRYIAIGIYNKTNGDKYSVALNHPGSCNIAETEAIRKALRLYAHNGCKKLIIYSDSMLIVYQLIGRYRVSRKLKPYIDSIRALTRHYLSVKFEWISPEMNNVSNYLCQRANGVPIH